MANGMRRPRGVVLACLLALAVSCTRDAGEHADGGPAVDPRLRGTLLVSTRFGNDLELYALPDGPSEPLLLPDGADFLLGAFLDADGSVIAVMEDRSARLRAWRLTADGPPVALGPALPPATATVSLAGERLLVAECDARGTGHLLDLADPTRWRDVHAGCGAALSEDGTSVAWAAPDARTLLEAPVDGPGDPEPVIDVREVEELRSAVGRPVWILAGPWRGPSGLAVVAGNEDASAVVVVSAPGGSVDVVPVIGTWVFSRFILAWRPGSERLAIGSTTRLEGIVRMVDPGGEPPRVVWMFPSPPAELLWSPAGDALLAASDAQWTFVDADGTWLRTVPMQRNRSLPLAWGP